MIQNKSVDELLTVLNESEEHTDLEAKSLRDDKMRSILETVCSFSNEPNLEGGTILVGIAESREDEGPRFVVEHIDDLDHAQADLATQCKTVFNFPVHPKVSVVKSGKEFVLKVDVRELPAARKPLYFKDRRLPHGAYRRVGGSDLVCTDEDISELFDSSGASYDATPVNASASEVDPNALKAYRDARAKVNPAAEELTFNDRDLLESLHCTADGNPDQLNVGGALLFGTAKMLRRILPMARVDYVRVPTLEWVEEPDDTYDTVDMRGPLMLLVGRLVNAVNDDLLRTFSLEAGDAVHSKSSGLPVKVIREAVVNALMHASYKVGSPTQIIRYPNRIEIRNAGYSLKSPDKLGEPGSVVRNKVIAPVFHETNTAETKGGGIRRMKRLMREAHFAQPTYESDRAANTFVLRLLLHHFLGETDLAWLQKFAGFDLTDGQKTALVFVREVRAIDNQTYRQMVGCDTLKASQDLRKLRDFGLLRQKGSGVSTYYVPSWEKVADESLADKGPSLVDKGLSLVDKGPSLVDKGLSLVDKGPSLMDKGLSLVDKERYSAVLKRLKKRMCYNELSSLICDLCSMEYLTKEQIVYLTGKGDYHIKAILTQMINDKLLVHKHPEMKNHPGQAYMAAKGEGVRHD